MPKELAYVLVNPYTISKSRTGGVISRITSRTGLDLVACRMFGPSAELVDRYADLINRSEDLPVEERALLVDHLRRTYAPDPRTGKRRRVLMLLFEGDEAIAKVRDAVGPIRPTTSSGETVRDTFGDLIVDEQQQVRYFEPAVYIGRSAATVREALRLWASYSERDGGLIADADDLVEGPDVQRTLVIIKPDNFRFPSGRPGNIIDLFSASGLRIIGAKVHRMSVAEGEEFYGPVQEVLRNKLKEPSAARATEALREEFGFTLPEDVQRQLGELVGPCFGDEQFYQILEFMTGKRPVGLTAAEKAAPGTSRCLVLIYQGPKAVERIRRILGPTDPSKAGPGSVRKEYGKDIMINAAHASDSPENAVREMNIVKPQADTIQAWVDAYTTT
ncbi:MAG TPA: nucleoside-diphosphate kinase [Kiritimatiellia bacterium]|nr:nucleoside-diphosphate kinase [Kiritimatiellia bacterium]HMP00350.1 nucleoside-diphosphate kinase [Kiritimatiellia bacterium]HMP96033.1 nucleoside-diphosphate kinase [Kiritimatiellia bacterium]